MMLIIMCDSTVTNRLGLVTYTKLLSLCAHAGPLDLSLVGWVMLFLSRTLDHTVGSSSTSSPTTASGSTEDDQEENGASGGATASTSSKNNNGNSTTDKDKGTDGIGLLILSQIH